MDSGERLQADYAGMGLTIGPHPMALRRGDLSLRGVMRAADLPTARNGRRVRVAGMVITRQRPGTAKGFVFLTLEDETGISNIIIRPDLFDRERMAVVRQPFLIVDGVLQHQDGVLSVRAERVEGIEGEPRSMLMISINARLRRDLPTCQMRIGSIWAARRSRELLSMGAARWRGSASTRRATITQATVDAITSIVADLERAAGARGTVGVGIPGTLSPDTGLVKNANSTWLLGRPLKTDLENALGREVRLANDANCFAVSEAADGAAAGADVVFGVIVGTGTGAGITVRGRVLTGPNGIAGEWGHNPLPWASGDEIAGSAVLLRQARLRRDLSLRPGPDPRA